MCKIFRSLVVFTLLLTPVTVSAFTVVIDAGHGGKDYGAVGHYLKLNEKDINLDISLRLASKIRTAYPEVKVVLTRSTDVFIPLQERANIVNRNNADLFICVHTNSADSRKAYGAEVFILGTEKMETNLDVAMRENSVIKLEADYQTTYQGFDPNSIDSYIIFELMQNQYMDNSLRFASMVQQRFVIDNKRTDRGVRQAGFLVLLRSACPSVLIEMGFISNKEEEIYLGSDKGKREITAAIFNAFADYYKPEAKADKKPEQKAEQKVEQKTEPKSEQKAEPKSEQKAEPKPEQKAEPKQEQKDGNKPQAGSQTKPQQASPQTKKEQAKYTVQLFASRHLLKSNDKEFKGLKNCFRVKRGEWYKYMHGHYATEAEAKEACKKLDSQFKGCFVVPIPEDIQK
ncbi:MAG: N-acetylmuramoyl-L-alanine amidase [Paludibacteraceae bacterium]|nr:N-acetylmuramoyl-L-alanine amidase [Paludibacteraceae bacterium]